jgi:hypothetical protein
VAGPTGPAGPTGATGPAGSTLYTFNQAIYSTNAAGYDSITLGDTTSNVYFFEGNGTIFYSILNNLVDGRVVTIIFKRAPVDAFYPAIYFADAVNVGICTPGSGCNLKISPNRANTQFPYDDRYVKVNGQGSITFVYVAGSPGYWYQIGYS